MRGRGALCPSPGQGAPPYPLEEPVRPFIIAWGVAWVAVGVGAIRSMLGLARLADGNPAPRREVVAQAAARSRRWAYAMVGMGALMALVSPWV